MFILQLHSVSILKLLFLIVFPHVLLCFSVFGLVSIRSHQVPLIHNFLIKNFAFEYITNGPSDVVMLLLFFACHISLFQWCFLSTKVWKVFFFPLEGSFKHLACFIVTLVPFHWLKCVLTFTSQPYTCKCTWISFLSNNPLF